MEEFDLLHEHAVDLERLQETLLRQPDPHVVIRVNHRLPNTNAYYIVYKDGIKPIVNMDSLK